jgi:hypothetical protein
MKWTSSCHFYKNKNDHNVNDMRIGDLTFLYNYQMIRKLTTWQWTCDYRMTTMQ